MRTFRTAIFAASIALLTAFSSCKKEENSAKVQAKFDIDSTKFGEFFKKHPEFTDYKKDVEKLYRDNSFRFVWYDKDGRNDFADVLYSRASQIEKEGVPAELPYKSEFENLFDDDRKNPDVTKELLISSMYFFYAKKVYGGLDPNKSRQLGWYLPREKMSYGAYLDELMKDPDKLKKDEDEMIEPYYHLKKGLQRYRGLRDKGGWGVIEMPKGVKTIKMGDKGPHVKQLRRRLVIAGDMSEDNQSEVFDAELEAGARKYEGRHNLKEDGIITQAMVDELNVPVEERIKTIIVNMERCRWLSPDIYKNKEFIAVNIPSYSLRYVKNGQTALQSNVVVGKELHKTVVFSGRMSYLVFSPYWNVPKSILENEIMPELEKDPGYLEKHNMEWNDEQVRQRPGGDNSLGLVKFMFPNSNNIYLHDTPAKSLFNKEERAFSHGCIRVQKARDLAVKILENDPNWNSQKIDQAMHAGTEQQYALKRKIPVYIAYFTAWSDENGNVTFFDDIYKRDARLAMMLYKEEVQ